MAMPQTAESGVVNGTGRRGFDSSKRGSILRNRSQVVRYDSGVGRRSFPLCSCP